MRIVFRRDPKSLFDSAQLFEYRAADKVKAAAAVVGSRSTTIMTVAAGVGSQAGGATKVKGGSGTILHQEECGQQPERRRVGVLRAAVVDWL